MKNPTISVVLGTYNRLGFLKKTINTIRKEFKTTNLVYEIIVIDGGSEDGTIKWLTKQKDIITIVQHNRGRWLNKNIEFKSWGYFMNLGFKCCKGKYICMLSDDCLIIKDSIINAYKLFERKLKEGLKLGAMAFYWRNWPGQEKYWVGLTLGNKMFVNHGIYLTKALKDVEFADEDTYSFYHADGDLCLKMWHKGYQIVEAPNSYVEHCSHVNKKVRRKNNQKQKNDWKQYLEKWEEIFYEPSKKNIGGWLEKEYLDERKTFREFGLSGYKVYFYVKLKSFKKNVVRSLLNLRKYSDE